MNMRLIPEYYNYELWKGPLRCNIVGDGIFAVEDIVSHILSFFTLNERLQLRFVSKLWANAARIHIKAITLCPPNQFNLEHLLSRNVSWEIAKTNKDWS